MAIIVFILGIIGIAWYVIQKTITASDTNKKFPISVVPIAGGMLIGLIVLVNLISAIVIVSAGSRVVVFDKFTGVKQVALGEGFHLIMPFVQDAIEFDVRVQKADIKASAASKDLQDVNTELVLNFRPVPESMPKIYQQYGTDYVEKVVSPAVQEAVKAVVATYTAEQIITKREELKGKVQDQLAAMIAKADLQLMETYMTNFNFSQGFAQAIESKQIAEQNALKAQRDLDRIKIEAEQKVANFRAEAEGLRLQKEAISPALIELRKVEASIKAIEKWNGVMPTTILGKDSVPFISMNPTKAQ